MKLEQELANIKHEELKRVKKYLERKELKAKGRSGVILDEVKKLQKELEERKKTHEIMKEANKILKSKKLSDAEKKKKLKEIGAYEIAEKFGFHLNLKPDFAGRVGFPDYDLRSNKDRMKRIEEKIRQLLKKAEESKKANEDREVIYDSDKLMIVKNYNWDRVQLVFTEKPPRDVIDVVKRYRFRYSPKTKSWIKKLLDYNVRDALDIAKELEKKGYIKKRKKKA